MTGSGSDREQTAHRKGAGKSNPPDARHLSAPGRLTDDLAAVVAHSALVAIHHGCAATHRVHAMVWGQVAGLLHVAEEVGVDHVAERVHSLQCTGPVS